MVTIKDVAKKAGVSIATASRAIRNVGYVNEETRARVLATAKNLGYTTDIHAQSLRSRKSNTIGVIVSDIKNYFYSLVLMEIAAELKKLGYMMLLAYSNENHEEESSNLKRLLSSRVDGIIFTPVDNSNKKLVNQIMNHGIPLLQLYRNAYDNIDSVLVDDETGAYLATQHLLDSGHRNILLLGVDSPISPSRSHGYIRAMQEKKVPVDDDLIMSLSPEASAKEVVRKQIHHRKPTAIIAGTNTFGLDVISVCQEENLNIPADISLVVFDDIPWVSFLKMTSIAQPISGISITAVHTLLDRIQKANDTSAVSKEYASPSSTSIKIDPILIKRSSVIPYSSSMHSGSTL